MQSYAEFANHHDHITDLFDNLAAMNRDGHLGPGRCVPSEAKILVDHIGSMTVYADWSVRLWRDQGVFRYSAAGEASRESVLRMLVIKKISSFLIYLNELMFSVRNDMRHHQAGRRFGLVHGTTKKVFARYKRLFDLIMMEACLACPAVHLALPPAPPRAPPPPPARGVPPVRVRAPATRWRQMADFEDSEGPEAERVHPGPAADEFADADALFGDFDEAPPEPPCKRRISGPAADDCFDEIDAPPAPPCNRRHSGPAVDDFADQDHSDGSIE